MSEEKAGHAPDVIAQQLIVAVQALRSIRDNVSAQTDWRDIETMAGDAIDAVFVLGAMPDDDPEPGEPKRYALVEQMGHRATIATVRETIFCGKPMLEMTELRNGGVHLVSPESLYEVTWLTEEEARVRVRPWTAVALPAGAPWESHGPDDDADHADYQREQAEEGDRVGHAGEVDDDDDDDLDYDDGRDDGMSAAEKDAYDREGEAILDALDEAAALEREAEADA